MTRLPVDTRLAVDRPDLPEYELNKACPVTGEVTGLEAHHIWRRSAGYPSWWVELPDGTIVGNRIMLSSAAHYRVTVNKAQIVYDGDMFYWLEAGERALLRWQPPKWDWMAEAPIWDQPIISEISTSANFSGEIPPGEECPSCHRRIPHPKKKSSPATTKPMTFGRAPADAADELKERIETLARVSGLSTSPYPQVRAIMLALLLAESVQIDTIRKIASEMTWGTRG